MAASSDSLAAWWLAARRRFLLNYGDGVGGEEEIERREQMREKALGGTRVHLNSIWTEPPPNVSLPMT